MPQPSDADKIAEALRVERDHLRAERDYYQEELARLRCDFSAQVQRALETSGRDIRTRVEAEVGALAGKWKWLIGLLIGAAGLGGYASIPGWIDGKVEKAVESETSTKVDAKVKERQAAVDKAMFEAITRLELTLKTTDESTARLRREVEDAAVSFRQKSNLSVSEFEKQAAAALDEVGKHASKTKAEMTERARLVVVTGATGAKQIVEANDEWFGDVPDNVIAVGATELRQVAFEWGEGGKKMGAFSHFFQKALVRSRGEDDLPEPITWAEAVGWTNRQLAATNLPQRAVISGQRAADPAVFSRRSPEPAKGKLYSLLIGCSRYNVGGRRTGSDFMDLAGPENDAREMARLIQSNANAKRLTKAEIASTKLLLNQDATRQNILAEVANLIASAKQDDLVFFVFSGHVLPDAKTKLLVPTDFNPNAIETNLRADELIKSFGKCAGTVVVAIDG